MSHSGKSATLLFEDGSSLERFSIAVGMHNYNPWCDIITDLPAEVKLSILNKTYYESRSGRLWANSTREEKVSSRGTKVLLNISDLQWDGSYMVTITISNP
ncbi:Cytolysin/lectin [Russula earlei]|uniref:Cytolysin/lectin n=1 Tax=Russula earlei TaxID=71964 RepID=A0ACC0U465_9AGAM|nr:Cytolysin/lectin [Russula earlei]